MIGTVSFILSYCIQPGDKSRNDKSFHKIAICIYFVGIIYVHTHHWYASVVSTFQCRIQA